MTNDVSVVKLTKDVDCVGGFLESGEEGLDHVGQVVEVVDEVGWHGCEAEVGEVGSDDVLFVG